MSTKKTIYLIRHGETDFNRKGIIQGSGINSELNSLGRWQAEQFHKTYGDTPFSRIYTSSLIRTQQSVEPFTRSGNKIDVLSELNEINWGVFEGVRSNAHFLARYRQIVTRWRQGHLDEPIEGGESPMEMYNRQKIGLQKILNANYDTPILICMHGRAMRSFLSLLLQTPLKDMDDYGHSNLCLYIIEMKSEIGELQLINDTTHLTNS